MHSSGSKSSTNCSDKLVCRGKSSIALNGLFIAFANYKDTDTAWDNSLDWLWAFATR